MAKTRPVVHPLTADLEYETVGGYLSKAHVTTSADGLSAAGYNLRTQAPVRLVWSIDRWKETEPS